MMEEIFGNEISDNWFKLVVSCRWYAPELNKYLVYGQGQGMGTTGSFLIATLSDHFYLEMIMEEHYGSSFDSSWYSKTGDDLVVNDPDLIVVAAYEQIGSLVNLAKSKGPTPKGSFLEYVSRISWDGQDVSRVSPNVINRSKDWRYIPLLLHVAGVISLRIPCDGLSTLDRKRKSDKRSYRSLLSDLLVTIKWTEESSQFQEFVRMDWNVIKDLGYFDEAVLDLNDDKLGRNYKVARAIKMLENLSKRAEDILSSLCSANFDRETMDRFAVNDDCLWNMDSESYKILADQGNVIKYTTSDGKVVVAPKSIFAGFLFRKDYEVISKVHEIIIKDRLTGAEDDINDINRELESVKLTNSFEDFKSFKETKALKNVIDLNLKVFQYYDPETSVLKVNNLEFLKSLGINPDLLSLKFEEVEPVPDTVTEVRPTIVGFPFSIQVMT
jgi:hypothetical protein